MPSRDSTAAGSRQAQLPELLVIHHTHWDREWYRSFEDFRYRLLQATKHVVAMLDEGRLPAFLFDGQTIVLDDVAQVAPEALTQRLTALIAAGNIEVGPWYVMPDEFLVGGESILRNLRIGIAHARRHGADPKVLYLPDTFGHASQMPQIARGLGLRYAVVARGVNQVRANLWWRAPDGSQVFTHALPTWEGYFNPLFTQDDYVAATQRYYETAGAAAVAGEAVLLPAGADHTVPPQDWPTRRAALRRVVPLRETTLATAMQELERSAAAAAQRDDVPQAPMLAGELRDNGRSYVLAGIASARVDIKHANQAAEELLQAVLEPLTLFCKPHTWAPEHIDHLWRLLITNHPHDSIGGCSIDQVHRENLTRYDAVTSGAQRHIQDMLRHATGEVVGRINAQLHLWNLLPWPSLDRVVVAEVSLPAQHDTGSIAITDANGVQQPFDLLSREATDGFYSEMEQAPGWVDTVRYRVALRQSFVGVGCRVLRVTPTVGSAPATSATIPDQHAATEIANDILRVRADRHGVIHVAEHGGRTVSIRLQWQRDHGDSYNSDPDAVWTAAERSEPSEELDRGRVHGRWIQSTVVSLTGPDGTRVDMKLELRAGEPFVRIESMIDNRSTDTRLSAYIDTNVSDTAPLQSVADTAYDLVTRTHRRDHDRSRVAEPQRELPPNEHPSLSLIAAGSVFVLHRGTHGYDIEPDGQLRVTLLRSVGVLSRGALRVRGGGAGPHIATPDAQLLGRTSVQWAVGLPTQEEVAEGGCDATATGALFWARRYRSPVIGYLGSAEAESDGLVCVHDRRLVTEALYRVAPTQAIIRLSNRTAQAIDSRLESVVFDTADTCDLFDTPSSDVAHRCTPNAAGWSIHLPPHTIATFLLQAESHS